MIRTFKNICDNTFLGRLFVNDPLMAKFFGLVVIFYAMIHIIKVEVFPFYLFAMYSQPVVEQSEYLVYDVRVDEDPMDLSKMDYRKYTYLMNTIGRYSDIIQHDMTLSEAQIIPKVLNKIYLDEGQLARYLMRNYIYDADPLEARFQNWLARMYSDNSNVNLIAKTYTFENGLPLEKLNTEGQ